MRHALQLCGLYASLHRPILFCGPVGAGKTMLAQTAHRASGRRGDLVAVSAGELSETLHEDVLFGHVSGAFTGASARRRGALARASGGSLLLDDIAFMPMAAQAAILRVIDSSRFRPLGSDEDEASTCRWLFATTVAPEDLVREGRLLRDLESRFGNFIVHVPPLRHRKEDIVPLAHESARRFLREHDRRAAIVLSEGAKDLLLSYDWPRNVRGLKHAIERAVVHAGLERDVITIKPCHLPDHIREYKPSAEVDRPAVTLGLIESTLRHTGGCRSEAARQLNVHRNTIGNRLRAASGTRDDAS
jgi:DNA-binding NtrC family response regulator